MSGILQGFVGTAGTTTSAPVASSMTVGSVTIPYTASKTFDYYDSVVSATQSNVNITVTSAISTRIQLFAAAGGIGGSGGGRGGGAQFTFTFQPGTTYILALGQGGGAAGGLSGGRPGGGAGGNGTSVTGGNGGGYSAIFSGSISQANVIAIVGGGGGGGGGSGSGQGGNAQNTATPLNGLAGGGTGGGGGATTSAGGTAGISSVNGTAGSALQGGTGATAGTNSGAGGGGGYYGGGGGGAATGAAAGGGGGGSGLIQGGATFESILPWVLGAGTSRGAGPLCGRCGEGSSGVLTTVTSPGLSNYGTWLKPWCTGTVGSTLPATGYDYVLASAFVPGATSVSVVVTLTTSASSTAAESVLRFGANYGRFFAAGTAATPVAASTTLTFTISGTTYTKACTNALQTTTNVNLTTTLGVAVPAGTVITVYVPSILVSANTSLIASTGSSAAIFRMLEPRGTYYYVCGDSITGGTTTPVSVNFALAQYPIDTIPAGTVIQRTNSNGGVATNSYGIAQGRAGMGGAIRITML